MYVTNYSSIKTENRPWGWVVPVLRVALVGLAAGEVGGSEVEPVRRRKVLLTAVPHPEVTGVTFVPP